MSADPFEGIDNVIKEEPKTKGKGKSKTTKKDREVEIALEQFANDAQKKNGKTSRT